MKQAYFLPCECGQKVEVDAKLAGLTVTCVCGRTLEVPTLRDIARLEPVGAGSSAGRATGSWGPRQGYTLVGLLIAIVGLAWFGYQLWTTPADLYVVPEDIRADLDHVPPAELVAQFDALSIGLDPTELPVIKASKFYQEWHRRWTYMAAGVSVFGVALASIAWFAIGAPGPPRGKPRR